MPESENDRLRAELAECRRAQQEAAQRASTHVQMALGAAIGGMLDPVFLHDREGRIVHTNHAYLALVGQESAQVLGRPYWEFFPRGDGPTPGCQQALAQPGVQEEEFQGPTGTVLRMRSFAVFDERGDRSSHSLHVLEDITGRKRNELARQESEERLRLALTAGQAGIWDWDLRTGAIVWSPEGYALHGFDPVRESPSFSDWEQRLHPDDRARTVQAVRDAIEGRAPGYHVEFRVNHPQQGVRWLLGIGQVERGPDGTAQRLLGIGLDVTERHQAAESLRRANEELERFTYVASHDLKAPLRAVHSLSSWIEEEVADHLSEEGRQRMRLLRERVRLMDGLINAMLDYSRAGARVAVVAEVAVSELVDEVVKATGPPAGFTISFPPDLPHLRTDRMHLRQVFANLIGNAVEHHNRPDGHVWVSVREKGDCYEFTVTDDGPGIPPEYQARPFEMFQPKPGGEPGTGIGLAVVRRVVERVGGQVTLESTAGQGATFRFTWPKVLPTEENRVSPGARGW